MFTLSINREFTAEHFLVGGDWGAENNPHSHNYRLELHLQGDELDEYGFLVDIVEIEEQLDQAMDSYAGGRLNDMPEFEGLNPTLEHFCRILCFSLTEQFRSRQLSSIEVRLWESESAWASYRLEL